MVSLDSLTVEVCREHEAVNCGCILEKERHRINPRWSDDD